MKILTVDDSASIRQMLAFTLSSAGYEVMQASDGEEGLARAKTNSFGLVITDLHMQRMGGIALIRELRKLPDYRFTPILMLTTDAAHDLKQEGRLAGATGWLIKPFNPDKLIATIERVAP